jgi:hypothetical protein
MIPVMTDATEASLSKGVSRNAAPSTQVRAAYLPQPHAHALHPSAIVWMREGARGAGRESGVEVAVVAVAGAVAMGH